MVSSAVLYVEIVPTTKGIQKQVEGAFGEPLDATEKKGSKVFANIAKFAKGAALAVTGIGAAVLGLAIKGGFDRALNIQDAQQKLIGLGHSAADVSEIMADALASVKGTAFGLDDAATVAASAVAAGIGQGKQLTQYLKDVADAASISGSSLSDMGAIFNQVQASGHAYNDTLQQLAQQGIPIYQWLAKELGTTTDAVFKLATQGKISSEQFRKAIEDNIAGAALSAGDTARGAFDNLRAAMSRFGVPLAQPFVDNAPGLFNSLSGAIDKVTAAFKPLTDQIGSKVGDVIGKMADAIAKFDPTKLVDFVSGLVNGGGLSGLIEFLSPLTLAFHALAPIIPEVGKQLGDLGSALATSLAPVLPDIADAFAQLVTTLVPLIPSIVQLIPPILQLLPPLLELAAQILPPLVQLLGIILPPVIAALSTTMEHWAPIIGFVVSGISGVFAAISDLFGLLTGDVSLEQFVQDAANIPGPVGAIVRGVLDFTNSIKGFFAGLIVNVQGAIGAVRDAVSGIAGFIAGAFNGVVGTVRNIFNGIIDVVNDAIRSINGVIGTAGSAFGLHIKLGLIPHLATGGTITSPGSVLVGEDGPEILRLNRGAQVQPLDYTDAIRPGGSDRPIYMDNKLFGIFQELADGTARIVLNEAITAAKTAQMGR